MLTEETRASFFNGLKSKEVYEKWISEYKHWAEERVGQVEEDAFGVLEFLKSVQEHQPQRLCALEGLASTAGGPAQEEEGGSVHARGDRCIFV